MRHIIGAMLPIFLGCYVALAASDLDIEAYHSIAFQIVMLACVVSAACSVGWFCNSVLASRPLVFLGDISFGVYLLHRPMIYLAYIAAARYGVMAEIALVIIGTVVGAYAAHVLIERPARLFIRRIGRAPAQQAAT